MDSSTQCPICAHSRHKSLYPAAYGKLLGCKVCKTVFFEPRPTPEELKAFYDSSQYREQYSSGSMADTLFAQNRYRELCRHLDRFNFSQSTRLNKTLLDVGCGVGDFLQVAMQDAWQVSGTELSYSAAQEAEQRLGCSVSVGDVSVLPLLEEGYDLITSYHVIEHLIDPVKMLKRLHQLIKPDGIVFLETPNIGSLGALLRGSKWSHIIPPEHINYFRPESLKYALNQAGFKRVSVFTSAPQIIGGTKKWPAALRALVKAVYGIAPRLKLGAALQAVAFKN